VAKISKQVKNKKKSQQQAKSNKTRQATSPRLNNYIYILPGNRDLLFEGGWSLRNSDTQFDL
jgi:hypothetical protein